MAEFITEKEMLPCMWKATTGMECPGCGTQRAFVKMAEGNAQASFAQFPALIPLLVLFLLIPIQLNFAKRISSDWILSVFMLTAFVMFGSFILKHLPV